MADAKVFIYSTPTCPYCIKVKDYLKEKGIEYTDYNVATDQAKAKEMIEKSGQMGVPVVIINDEIIVGFDQMKMDELLGL